MNAKDRNRVYRNDDVESLSMSMSSKRIEIAQTFCGTVENVRRAIEIECFVERERTLAEELCKIIAEVMLLPPNAAVRIAGNDFPAQMISEIYQLLDHEHIEFVIDNYKRMTYRITAKKTYLRTALYNSIFEYESHIENQVAMCLGGNRGGST